MTSRTLAAATALCLFASAASAGGKGTTGAAFLKVPVNARALAMGGTFTAVPGDVTALEYNPAGLVTVPRTDIALTYISYLEDTSFQSGAIAFPFTLGRKDLEVAEGEFDRRKLVMAARYTQFSGDDEARSEVGIKQGSINLRDQLFHAAVAIPARSRLSVGGAIKAIRQELGTATASGQAADAGALWVTPRQWRFGASVLNLGSASAFEDEEDPLPLLIRLGVSRTFKKLLFAADAVRGRDSVTRVSSGLEWAISQQFRLRGGAFHESEPGVSAGIGLTIAGPQKAAPAPSRGFKKSEAKTTELVFNEGRAADLLDRLNLLAAELTERFQSTGRRPGDFQLAVLPAAGAGERMGPALADLLGQQFYQQEAFQVVERSKIDAVLRETKIQTTFPIDDGQGARIGRMLGAQVVAISELNKTPTSYNLLTRLVLVGDENAAAASSASFPTDIFSLQTRTPLASVPARSESSQPAGRMDLGLDYGVATQGEFGFSHTLTLRILY